MVSALDSYKLDSHGLDSRLDSGESSGGAESSWIFAPSFPASCPSTSAHYMRESIALRFQAKHQLRQILACKHTTHKPTSRKSTQQNLNRQNLNPRNLPHTITLGIGGNVGSERQILARFFHLLRFLTRLKSCALIYASPIYRNPPFGYTNQPHFYNATLHLATSLSLTQVFALVFYLERRFGRARKRAFKNAPRTLDIDIIFYDKVIIKRSYLTIPHREFHKRESILLPLCFESMYHKE